MAGNTLLFGLCFYFLSCSAAAGEVVINNHIFPDELSLGVATAAYQIEGAWNEGGRGESMWDWFMHKYPEKIENGGNGDVACDSYHKWQEDIELLKQLGVNHYRFSISWSRILPDGLANNFTINQEGVDYYRNILQALQDAKITPYVTLYHWDLPLPLHQMGGWQNRLIADHFADYARICFELFGDIVKNWFTLNEPATYCTLGYGNGYHAPGYSHPAEGVYKCAYVSVLAHAKAYHIYNNEFKEKQGGRVSIVINTPWFEPKTNNNLDKTAAQRNLDFMFGLYADPIYLGNWPKTVIDIVEERSRLEEYSSSRLPKFSEEEIKLINGTSDFFGLNTYATQYSSHKHNADENIDYKNPSYFNDMGIENSVDPSWPGDVDWVDLAPLGFRALLKYVQEKYSPKEIFVAENGWAATKSTDSLSDSARITYIKQYLSALLDAVYDDKVSVTGYTVWSLMDNLEWSHGYQQKLGLVQVDFDSVNRTRTPKDSYNWFQGVLKNKCLADDVQKCTSKPN